MKKPQQGLTPNYTVCR